MAKNANGLGSIYYDKSAKTWRGSVTLGRDDSGKLKRKTFTGKTQKIVKDKMDKFIVEFDTDSYLRYNKMTLCELIELWYKEYIPNVSDSTIKARKRGLINLFKDNQELNTIFLVDFTKTYVNRNLASYLKEHSSSKVPLKLAMNFAVRNDYIKNNPLEAFKLTRTKPQKKRYMLNEKEQKQFLDEASKFFKTPNLHREYYYPMLYFLYWTGLRIGERCALTWDSIDFDHNCMTINKTVSIDTNGEICIKNSTKTNKDRIVPLHKEALRVLEFLQEHPYYTGPEYIFAKKNNKTTYATPNCARDSIKSLCNKAGIEPFSYHFLRHNFISMLIDSGASPVAVRELVGHESPNITLEVYAHINSDVLKNTLEMI